MDGLDEGVMDTPELDAPEVDVDDAELGNAEGGLEEQQPETEQTEQQASDDPFTTRFGRDYRQWLNNLKQTDPNAAKFVKQARDSYGREFALKQLEPTGIDGIREKYALLNSLTHGEAKGTDAIAAMQERLQQTDEVDTLLAAGDPRALESLGEDFNPGLAKLAPAILDRVSQSDPEAYQAAVLPHVVKTLMASPLLGEYNGKIDEINWRLSGRTLDQLSEQELRQIAQTAIAGLTGVSKNFNAMGQKAGEVKAAPTNQRSEIDTRSAELDQREQKMHWDTQIEPKVQSHEKSVFDKLFDPYQKRLKLGDPQKSAAFSAFHKAVIDAAQQDQAFQRQWKLYKSQKSPDPTTVVNFINHSLTKYGTAAMAQLVKDRWEPFLTGRPRTSQIVKLGTKPNGPVEPNVEVRSVKPPMHEIDHQNTPLDWTAMSYPGGRKYRLLSGKVVQVRSVV